jgi:hypothetical protein
MTLSVMISFSVCPIAPEEVEAVGAEGVEGVGLFGPALPTRTVLVRRAQRTGPLLRRTRAG